MIRKHLPLKTKLAAALCQMLRVDDATGKFVPIITFEESRCLSAEEIISRFHFDHYPVPHAEGGPDEPWNITPRLKPEHVERTRKIDIPKIAKNKRVARDHQQHVERMEAKATGRPRPQPTKPKRKIGGRSSFPTGRKFDSRRQA